MTKSTEERATSEVADLDEAKARLLERGERLKSAADAAARLLEARLEDPRVPKK